MWVSFRSTRNRICHILVTNVSIVWQMSELHNQLVPVFYEFYNCDCCQTKNFEEFSTFSHDSRCIANSILFSVIPLRFLKEFKLRFAFRFSLSSSSHSRINISIPRVLGLDPRRFQLFFQPQRFTCGLCQHDFPRRSLLRHFLLCNKNDSDSALQDLNPSITPTTEPFLQQCAVQIEFASP